MFHRRKLSFLSGLSALLLICTLLGMQIARSPNAYADYTVTVTPGLQYQTIQGWGTSMAWWAENLGGPNDSQRTALADALYSPTKGIGLNVLRYNFGADGPGNVCEAQQVAARRAVPSFEPTNGNYVWTNDPNQLWFAQAAQARGADVFEGFVNSAPAWMLDNSCTAGGANGAENLNPADYSAFASYIATIAKHFHDNFGITLQTVEPFNEPSSNWWTTTSTQEGMAVSAADQNTIIPLVASALSANGASAYTSVSSQDDNAISQAYNDYQSYSSSTKADMPQWNTHAYSGSDTDRANAYANIGQTGHKRLWMSEWGIGNQGSPIAAALSLSKEVLDDEQHLHPSSWVAWQAVNEAGDASPDDVWGLAYLDSNGNISYPARYYAMGNYSKFVREGYRMIGNSDANSFTAYNASTNSLVIVTTNSSTSSEAVSYNLSAFNNVGASATPYQTSASENLQQLANVSISNKTFTSTLPAQSITTFVIPNVTYTPSYSTIVNRNSGMLMDVNGASATPGANVIQWSSNSAANQQWNLVPLGNGYYTIVNRNSGMVLDVSGASTSTGAKIIQWPSNGGTNQQWSLVSVSGGYYELVNRNSGLLADVTGASTSGGANVIQWSSNGGTNQQWSIVAA
jgi:O-glycosyl hydrolase